ncbi:MAG: hypothetical protein ABEI58_02055 [Candidatus Nanohaloarchaea archaeon]
MKRDNAKRQLQRAQDMLGISDERAEEIFEEQPDRKQQRKKEIEEKTEEVEDTGEESGEESEDEEHTCDECGKSFDSERGLKSHASQVH